jgi:inorganic pyrophosphatase
MDQLFPHTRREIEHFFTIYKELEGKKTQMQGWGNPMEVRETIMRSRKAFLDGKAAD